jgi:hypothetical protein
LYVILWPEYNYCSIEWTDFFSKFEAEKHSFSGSASEKVETEAIEIHGSPQVDFIPLDILTELPNLTGIHLWSCNLPTVKSGLFKPDFGKLEYLNLHWCNIETIEPEAFQYLIKLQWVRLCNNKIKSLPDRVFANSPDLIYIDLEENKITSIVPNFFDGLEKLQRIDLGENLCIDARIGCETCQITQSDLKGKLQACFDICALGTNCHNTH